MREAVIGMKFGDSGDRENSKVFQRNMESCGDS